MLIILDLQSRLPIYEQLKSKIIELVMVGELKPDDQLPSVRNFARDLGVNPNTVQKAYNSLERDGIIYSVAGRGSYIHPEIAKTDQLQRGHLHEIKQLVFRAKACGIEEQQVVRTVQEVYREEEQHDHSNKID